MKALMRLHTVSRWGVVPMTRCQNVAEHSFHVLVLAAEIGLRAGLNSDQLYDVLRLAMFHDGPEAFTGDINSVVKNMMSIEEVERQLAPDYKLVVDSAEPLITAVVKIADVMEACWYSWAYSCGPDAGILSQRLAEKLDELIGDVGAQFPQYAIASAANCVYSELCEPFSFLLRDF
jgi:5'-deoxynucleotidase YfbR-like HD superfamily hydrolase